ncbi:MAG: DUF2953 domain-containing protein [Firmicutes bacterium]|nr:DUF2953 domain-containing protein [Bacillota bacterium]
MKISLIILSALVITLILLLFLPVRLEIMYENEETEEKVKLVIKYGFIKYRIHPNKSQKKSEKKEKSDKDSFSYEKKKAELQKYIHIFNAVKEDVSKLLSYAAKRAVVFDKIAVKSEFGFDDSMHTGIFTGLYNGFVYSIMGVLHHTSNLKNMDVKLQPIFGKKCFNIHFSCILHIKTAHIIVIAFNVLRIFRKIKKEGRL